MLSSKTMLDICIHFLSLVAEKFHRKGKSKECDDMIRIVNELKSYNIEE